MTLTLADLAAITASAALGYIIGFLVIAGMLHIARGWLDLIEKE
jgi:hypothetical protein